VAPVTFTYDGCKLVYDASKQPKYDYDQSSILIASEKGNQPTGNFAFFAAFPKLVAAKTTAFPKPPVPSGPKPPKMSELLEFGSGKDVPGLQRTFSREYLEQNGITREVAEQWRDVYRWQVENMPKNPAAPGRLDLMERVIETLSGG